MTDDEAPRGAPRTAERRGLRGTWTALLPITYALHILEEYRAGETFYGWISRVAGVQLGAAAFLAINRTAFVVLTLAVVLANVVPGLEWMIAALGSVITINALLHGSLSILTASYSPGTVTGVLLWLPLGLFILRRAWTALPRRTFWPAVAVGVLLHAMVTLTALNAP
ncbi:MAG: HXXEE domain-containing protein [Gemmatimonadota bacterium]